MSTQLADALRALVNATFHMTDTSTKTGTAFPDAHRVAREALKNYDASDEARRARAKAYMSDVGKRIEELADELEMKLTAEKDFTPYLGRMRACVAHLRTATDALYPL